MPSVPEDMDEEGEVGLSSGFLIVVIVGILFFGSTLQVNKREKERKRAREQESKREGGQTMLNQQMGTWSKTPKETETKSQPAPAGRRGSREQRVQK